MAFLVIQIAHNKMQGRVLCSPRLASSNHCFNPSTNDGSSHVLLLLSMLRILPKPPWKKNSPFAYVLCSPLRLCKACKVLDHVEISSVEHPKSAPCYLRLATETVWFSVEPCFSTRASTTKLLPALHLEKWPCNQGLQCILW